MVTERDEGKGVVKTYWSELRDRVAAVEPYFAAIVDKLAPDETFPIYLAYYPYGMDIGDTETFFLPHREGKYYKLSDSDAPKDIVSHLGYGIQDSPLGMVLEKSFEQFIDFPDENVTIPWAIYKPGSFFSFRRNLSRLSSRVYAPNGVLTAVSGARSASVLASIGCTVNHTNLQREFNVKSAAPKSLYEHWNIFKEILDSRTVECNWRNCLIYFSEKWVTYLHKDPAWLPFKLYLHEVAWNHFDYAINKAYHDFAFSVIQKKRNLKPNPYLVDTARHLFTTALGVVPGYAPAIDDEMLPLDFLQDAFVHGYNLKKYFPTIMQPTHFSYENDKDPVYYSLHCPTTYTFSPKSRKVSSTLVDLRELSHIMEIFTCELGKKDTVCSDTIMGKIARDIDFKFFHNELDPHGVITNSSSLSGTDNRFENIDQKYKLDSAKFAADAPFLRGCISISKK